MESLVRSFMDETKAQLDLEVGSVGWNNELETGICVLDRQQYAEEHFSITALGANV